MIAQDKMTKYSEEISPGLNYSGTFFDNRQYSINLMWINHRNTEYDEYVCAGKNRVAMDYVLKQLKKWRSANLNAEINFWYDSQCTHHHAIINTTRLLDEITMDGSSPINLRDVREIPFILANDALFQVSIPVYFRVDFLKLIIAHYLMEQMKMDSVIYTDLSICDKVDAALTQHELYTEDAVNKLKQFGMLLGHDLTGKAENQFLQMLNTPELLASLKHAINSCLLLSVNTLNDALIHENPSILEHVYNAPFVATLFSIYIYLFALQTNQPIKIRADVVKMGNRDEWLHYEAAKHGYMMFGNKLECSELGSVYQDNRTGEISDLTKITKLPDGLNFAANCIDITELGDAEHACRLRCELHPGHGGQSHPWCGQLPRPTQDHEFKYTFWPTRCDETMVENIEIMTSPSMSMASLI